MDNGTRKREKQANLRKSEFNLIAKNNWRLNGFIPVAVILAIFAIIIVAAIILLGRWRRAAI